MNKIKLLLLLLMAVTGMAASAADAGFEFVESDGGKTLTIRGYGDLTTASKTVTEKVFAAAANGNIFTNNSGTSVTPQAEYNPSATYYYAEDGYTQVFDSGKPVGDTYVYSVSTAVVWNEALVNTNDTYIYPMYMNGDKVVVNGSRITSGYRNDQHTFTYNGNTYTYYTKLSSAANSGDQINATDDILLTEEELANYMSSTTTYTAGYNYPIYRSQDGGTTKEKLTSGQVYTYKAGDLFYVANSNPTLVPITKNAAFFAAHPAYLEDAEVTTTFKDALLAQLSSGSYTKVVFENTGTKGEMLIDPQIAQEILYNGTASRTDITTVDLGEATLKLTGEQTFKDILINPNANSNVPAVTDLTIPMMPKVGDEMTLPASALVGGIKNTSPLKTLTVPSGYTKIGNSALSNASVITTVNLPEGLKVIGDNAFSNCTNLTNLNITGAPVEGRSIVLPSSLEEIGKEAFYACGSLTSTAEDPFILPSGLKKVKASAFVNLTNLKFLELNEGLEYVGNSAFGLNNALYAQTTIIFPSTIKYLGPGSFISRWYQDIYFTGKEAPVCPVGTPPGVSSEWGNVTAFSANTQMGNNGFNPYLTEGSTADNAHQEGYANRENYINNGYYFSILHFPAGLTDAQAKTYRDITRRYVTAKGNEQDTTGEKFYYSGSIANFIDPVTSETFGSAFKEGTTGGKSNLVYYMSDNGLLTESANAANLQPGYIDTYLGAQQIWPSQMQWTRSFVTVANGVEWDGKTPYRPTLTKEMFEWMKEDELYVKANSLDYSEIREADDNYDDASQRKGEVLSLAEKTWEQLTDREKDYLSLILYQGTRRFVLGNDSPYKIPFKLELEKGRWYSICLPFNMTKKQIDEVFGEGTHVCLFSRVIRTTETDGKLLRLEFTNDVYHHKTERTVQNNGSSIIYTYGANYSKANPEQPADNDIVIYARESYMIYPMEESDDPSGVAIRNFGIPEFTVGDPLPTMIQANSDKPYEIKDSGVAYRFIGNFNSTASYGSDGKPVTVKVPRYSYIYATSKSSGESKFYILNTDNFAWSPFKSIVQNLARNGGEDDDWNNFFQKSSTGAKQVSIFGFDDSMTGIEDVIIEVSSDNGADKAVYSINGSHVGDSLQGLAPGVYVKQGKAYIVK